MGRFTAVTYLPTPRLFAREVRVKIAWAAKVVPVYRNNGLSSTAD